MDINNSKVIDLDYILQKLKSIMSSNNTDEYGISAYQPRSFWIQNENDIYNILFNINGTIHLGLVEDYKLKTGSIDFNYNDIDTDLDKSKIINILDWFIFNIKDKNEVYDIVDEFLILTGQMSEYKRIMIKYNI